MTRASLVSPQTDPVVAAGGCGSFPVPEVAVLDDLYWDILEWCRFPKLALATKQLVMNLRSFVTTKGDSVYKWAAKDLVEDIVILYLSRALGIVSIIVKCDKAKKRDEAMPSLISLHLPAILHNDFCRISGTPWENTVAFCCAPTDIDAVQQEQRDLLRAICVKPTLDAAIGACKGCVPFEDGWYTLKRHYEYFWRFVVRITIFFPGTSQVQNCFSILKAEKKDFRNFITGFPLNGTLCSKQVLWFSFSLDTELEQYNEPRRDL